MKRKMVGSFLTLMLTMILAFCAVPALCPLKAEAGGDTVRLETGFVTDSTGARLLEVKLIADYDFNLSSFSGTLSWECKDTDNLDQSQLKLLNFRCCLPGGTVPLDKHGDSQHEGSVTCAGESYNVKYGETLCSWVFTGTDGHLPCGQMYMFSYTSDYAIDEMGGSLSWEGTTSMVAEYTAHDYRLDKSVSAGTNHEGFFLRLNDQGYCVEAVAHFACRYCGYQGLVLNCPMTENVTAEPAIGKKGSAHYSFYIMPGESLDGESHYGIADLEIPAIPGWKKEGGKWYYYTKEAKKKIGWLNDGGKWYLLGPDGAMKTGWQYSSGKWYLFGSDGIMKTGWQKYDGKWYLLGPDGDMKTGWQKDGGKWYLLGPDGAMKTGWQQSSGKWYLLGSDGVMKTGWQKDGGSWYYLGTDGVMRTGWQTIGGKQYFFKSNGVMCENEWFQGYWFNASGTWTYKYKASWHTDSKGRWFGDSSGWYAKNETLKIDNVMYTFGADGYLK